MRFIGRRDLYWQNVSSSSLTHAKAAFMDGPNGIEPAVAIFRDKFLCALLTLDDAIRISNFIVDSVEQHSQGVTP
ncbi:hypothetical protein ACVWY0_004455 [Arthrobacter sp. UYNi723]